MIVATLQIIYIYLHCAVPNPKLKMILKNGEAINLDLPQEVFLERKLKRS